MKVLLISLSFILLFSSCSKESEKIVPILDLEDLIVDTLYLQKDTLTKNLGYDFTYFKTDSIEVLATFINHKLLVYSYPEGKVLVDQTFEKEGPNGIGSYITGNLIDKESLYILSQQKELIQCDFNGKVLGRWDLPEVDAKRKYPNYGSYLFNRLQKYGDDLYFVDIPYVFQEGFEDYAKWGMVFDTKTYRFSHFNFLYPKTILKYTQDDQLGLFSHVFNPQTKEHLIGFSISDSIAVVKEGNQTWKWAGTSSTLTFKRGTTVPSGEYTIFQPNYESSKYEGMDIASQAGKLIRWVRLKGPSEEYPEREESRLLVFDENLKPEAELDFDAKKLSKFGFNLPTGYALNLYTETTDDLVAYAVIDFSKINPSN